MGVGERRKRERFKYCDGLPSRFGVLGLNLVVPPLALVITKFRLFGSSLVC